MATTTTSFQPYTYIQCPCSDTTNVGRPSDGGLGRGATAASTSRDASAKSNANNDGSDSDSDDGRTFDPRAPRSNYSLYPLEHLLYCSDCHAVRCPRCVAEEVVTYYCPSCLFEVPSSSIRSEGNRCTRNCFLCPVCQGPAAVQFDPSGQQASSPSSSTAAVPNPNLLSADNANPAAAHQAGQPQGPFILGCLHCSWTSQEAGLVFDRASGMYAQLARMRAGPGAGVSGVGNASTVGASAASSAPSQRAGQLPVLTEEETEEGAASGSATATPAPPAEPESDLRFALLRAFYALQLNPGLTGGAGGSSSMGEGSSWGSPAALARLMTLYAGHPSAPRLPSRGKLPVMREAAGPEEGLLVANLEGEREAVKRLAKEGWLGMASKEQRGLQAAVVGGVSSATVLATTTTGVSNRAGVSSGPTATSSAVVGSSGRFVSDLRPIPALLRTKRSKRCPVCRHIMSKPEAKVSATRFRIKLVAGNFIPTIGVKPLSAANAHPYPAWLHAASTVHSAGFVAPQPLLVPGKPAQFLLTFKNPVFERVRISLATPAETPGRFKSRVTLMCPQFEVDANTDMWDEALTGTTNPGSSTPVGGSSASGGDWRSGSRRADESASTGQAEAGKIWERGRNWVSVVVEVVPASLRQPSSDEGEMKDIKKYDLNEDDDVVEIPMFVRVEWEADAAHDDVGSIAGGTVARDRDGKEAREKRELAYWCVVGVGRIAWD